jgi:hypothetical protein
MVTTRSGEERHKEGAQAQLTKHEARAILDAMSADESELTEIDEHNP